MVRMLLLSSLTAMVPERSFDLLFPLSWRCSVCTDCRSLGSPVSTTWPKNSSLIKLWFQIWGKKTRQDSSSLRDAANLHRAERRRGYGGPALSWRHGGGQGVGVEVCKREGPRTCIYQMSPLSRGGERLTCMNC